MGRTLRPSTSVNHVKITDTVESKKAKQPTKLTKEKKTKQREINPAVIIAAIDALNESASNLEKGNGFALVTIRTHISKTLGFKVGKTLQMKIKETIAEEFRGGRIIMTNNNGGKLDFRKRFDSVAGKKKETPRVNN